MLNIDPSDAVPIWKQIEDELRRLVAIGHLVPGGGVPSVREVSQHLRVNPATVTRAYQRLVDAGIFVVRRGEGTFVLERPATPPVSERREALGPAALKYASLAATLGAGPEEAKREIDKAFALLGEAKEKA